VISTALLVVGLVRSWPPWLPRAAHQGRRRATVPRGSAARPWSQPHWPVPKTVNSARLVARLLAQDAEPRLTYEPGSFGRTGKRVGKHSLRLDAGGTQCGELGMEVLGGGADPGVAENCLGTPSHELWDKRFEAHRCETRNESCGPASETALDALAAGGEYLSDRGYRHSWGIGRHIEGSQIFDYWRDPDGFLVEHYADGDMFDCTVEPGWAPFTASGLSQWGPPATKDFLGIAPGRQAFREIRLILDGVRDDNEFDLASLRGMLKTVNA
jgi:hypothetical protein